MLIFLAILLLTPGDAFDTSSACSTELIKAGLCPPADGTEVVIGGTEETPGSSGGSDRPIGRPIGDIGPNPISPSAPVDEDFVKCLEDWDSYIRCFEGTEPGPDDDEEEGTAEIPAITITDVARFAPHGTVVAGEPDNVGVVGLPANFVAAASEHTVDGELFGFPMNVHFTPSGYDFDFGDGTALSTTTGGQSWEALGQAQFTPTDTSHAYTERGAYSAHVDVRYTAAVDFGIGWFPITGEVTAAGSTQEVRIFEARTALVAATCQEKPLSPGC